MRTLLALVALGSLLAFAPAAAADPLPDFDLPPGFPVWTDSSPSGTVVCFAVAGATGCTAPLPL